MIVNESALTASVTDCRLALGVQSSDRHQPIGGVRKKRPGKREHGALKPVSIGKKISDL